MDVPANARSFQWLCGSIAGLALFQIFLHGAFLFRAPATNLELADKLCWWTVLAISTATAIRIFRRPDLPWRLAAFAVALAMCAPAVCRGYEAWALNRALTRAAGTRLQGPDLESIENKLRWAAEHRREVRAAVALALGTRLLDQAADTTPGAGKVWHALIELLNYESAIETVKPFDGTEPQDPEFARSLVRLGTLAVTATVVRAGYRVVTRPQGPGMLLLDGCNLKHVRFRGVPIGYLGGSLRLADASFEQCTFYIQKNSAGLRLVRAFLNSPHSVSIE